MLCVLLEQESRRRRFPSQCHKGRLHPLIPPVFLANRVARMRPENQAGGHRQRMFAWPVAGCCVVVLEGLVYLPSVRTTGKGDCSHEAWLAYPRQVQS